MKIRCERDVLFDALSAAGRAVSTRSTNMAVLSGVQLHAHDQQLTLTGTDLDLTIQLSIDVSVIEPGVCVIPARLITDIVKAVAPGAVTLEVDDHEARISAGRSQFAVRVLDPEEFPRIAVIENFRATLPAPAFSEALRQVVRREFR